MARLIEVAWLALIFLACAGTIKGQGRQIASYSTHASVSAEGRYVAFVSEYGTLPEDTNGYPDVYVYDVRTGGITRISVDSAGNQANGPSPAVKPAINGDGRFVAFVSEASNLVAGDNNNVADIFVHDRQTGATTRISVDSAGALANAASSNPAISADGRYVAFVSEATNLVAGDSNGVADVFIRDRETGTTKRLSVGNSGVQGNGPSSEPSISADGLFVAFASQATNLGTGDTNGAMDVFVRDRQSGTTTRVSVSDSGAQGNGDSRQPSISADNRYVAFVSSATNLATGDASGFADVFVRDRQAGKTTRVSVDSAGNEGNGESVAPSISGDGRFVAFHSMAWDDNGYADIFVHDRQLGETRQVSDGQQGSLSADGRFVAFESQSQVYVGAVPRIEVDVSRDGSQFSASVSGTTNQGVTWSIHPAVGGINAQGLYTAPSPINTPLVVTVNAKSVADSARSGAAWMPLGGGFGEFYYTDTFRDLFLDGWTVVDQGTTNAPSNWKVIDGILTQTSDIYGGSTDAFVPNKPGTYLLTGGWTNYTVSARLRSTDDDAIGILFGYEDANNYYRFSMDRALSYRRLVKVVNGVFSVLAQDAVAYQVGRWYNVQATMARGIIQILVDGQMLFDVRDTSHTAGGIAFYSWRNTGAQFDDVAVVDRTTLGCMYSFRPAAVDVGSGASTGGVNVTTQSDCSIWALRNVPWLEVVSEGLGSGTLQFTVAANSGLAAREGKLTLENATFTVRQAGTTAGFLDEDHFSTGVLAGRWTVVDEGTANAPSSWSVSNGQLHQTSNIYGGSGAATELPMKGTYALTGESTWTNYRVRVRMRSTDSDAMGVMFGYENANNYYRFSLDRTRGYRRLVKVVYGAWTKLAQDSVAYTLDQWYTVEASMADGKIKIVVDGQPLFTVNDSAHRTGKVALYSWSNTGAHFDDFSVRTAEGTLTHCVSGAGALHAALAAAAGNGQNDVIRLVQGQYNGNFVYQSTEALDLTIEGGYTANCAARVVNPENTVLDGREQCPRVLKLDTSRAADFALEGLTLQKGGSYVSCWASPGGLWAKTAGAVILKKNILRNNNNVYSGEGGGAHIESHTAKVEDSTFTGNISNFGAGMHIAALAVELRRNTISKNKTESSGGAPGEVDITCPGGEWVSCTGTVILANNTIAENNGGYGTGGVTISHDRIFIEGNVFRSEFEAGVGAAIHARGSEITFINNLVAHHYCGSDASYAPVTLSVASQLYVTNNTIVDNYCSDSGGLYVDVPDGASASIYNNIIVYNHTSGFSTWGQDLGINNGPQSRVLLYNNDFDHFAPGTWIQVPFPIDPSNFNNVDPLFVSGSYRLQPTSLVINRGLKTAPKLPATDIEGNPRILFGTVDLGSYEATRMTLGPPSNPSPASNATAVSLTPTLRWMAGASATSFDVYFGTASTPPKVTNVTGTSYAPGTLSANKIYYWRIVARTSGGATTASPIWSFTTK